jgi:N-acetylmuramoyl-L-alanine amidase
MDLQQLTTARWELLNRIELTQVTRNLLVDLLSDRLGFAPPGMQAAEMRPIAPLPPPDSSALIALCLGHARKGDQGAASVAGVTEEMWHVRNQLLDKIEARLAALGVRAFVVRHYEGNDYAAAMRWLAAHLRERGATAAVEFHFNAASPDVGGHETLYHAFSRYGVSLAEMVNARWTGKLPGQNRKAKPITARARGGLFVSLTHCPAAILEPFFGTHAAHWKFFQENLDLYIEQTALGIKDFVDFYRAAKP